MLKRLVIFTAKENYAETNLMANHQPLCQSQALALSINHSIPSRLVSVSILYDAKKFVKEIYFPNTIDLRNQ